MGRSTKGKGSTSGGWDESKHPRVPAGSARGGEFTKAQLGGWTEKQLKASGIDPAKFAARLAKPGPVLIEDVTSARLVRPRSQRYGGARALYRDFKKLSRGK